MHETEKNDGFDVVAVVMERGYTNVAMDAARKAGARGGTVISARGIAENEVKRFFGIEIQAEKEIVFLVVRSDEKQQVMTALISAMRVLTDPAETGACCIALPQDVEGEAYDYPAYFFPEACASDYPSCCGGRRTGRFGGGFIPGRETSYHCGRRSKIFPGRRSGGELLRRV